jgi:hypothetical protein
LIHLRQDAQSISDLRIDRQGIFFAQLARNNQRAHP